MFERSPTVEYLLIFACIYQHDAPRDFFLSMCDHSLMDNRVSKYRKGLKTNIQ